MATAKKHLLESEQVESLYNHPFDLDEEYFQNFTSAHTISSYKNDINQFFEYIFENFDAKNYQDIERIQVLRYRNWLSEFGGKLEGPSAPKTIARKLASISSYFNYLVEKRLLISNPVISVKRPKRAVKSPTHALNAGQVRELLEAIDLNSNSGHLHKSLLLTFFTTGLRKSEILNLRFCDYKSHGDEKIIVYQGKGGKHGRKLLHPKCVEAIEDYLAWMKDQQRAHEKFDWLFQPTKNPSNPKNLNKPLNPKTINEIVEKYGKKIGLGFKLTPHSARATFIGELLENGVDIYAVAREVNHSSVTTTGEYDKRRKELSDSPIHKLKY